MRTIEHHHCRARGLILALMNVQVSILDVQRNLQPFTLDGAGERRVDIEIQCVAEFILFGRAGCLYAGRKIARVMPSEICFAQRSQ